MRDYGFLMIGYEKPDMIVSNFNEIHLNQFLIVMING